MASEDHSGMDEMDQSAFLLAQNGAQLSAPHRYKHLLNN